MEKTLAAIISGGQFIGLAYTEIASGEPVCYGHEHGSSIVQIGRGKISRAKKWMTDEHVAFAPRYVVNQGGGPAI